MPSVYTLVSQSQSDNRNGQGGGEGIRSGAVDWFNFITGIRQVASYLMRRSLNLLMKFDKMVQNENKLIYSYVF